ncbi:MAG: DsbE family thiol:disulfide interchange protein [Piscinibacter sp.]|uniref:DsbE family thiol:disulfide interchange protein n=1 Tax=Piscinibacter aquaticus TaxID=392597 RepID=A0A5C6U3C5_9BURK|nr:DsbE family thiol:disulfide interchange protein [Piscinibacter aquaticus]
MKSLKFLIPLAIFLVLAGFLAVGLNLNPREVPSPLIGKPAPAFELTKLDAADQKLKRDDLLGKVWVLNVWASWCAPCREEHPLVMELARRKLAPVYGLNYKDTRPAGMAFLTQLGNPYEASLFDGDGRVGIDWGVYGVPETFVVDKQGTIRFKHIGPLTPEVLEKKITPLLKELNA